MIDIHVHFRDWNQSYKETIYHGLKIFGALNYHMVCDMPNTDPPMVTKELLDKRVKEGKEASKKLKEKYNYDIDYYCYAGLTNDINQIKDVINAYKTNDRIIGFKYFACHSTGNMGVLESNKQNQIFKVLSDLNYKGFLAMHCEYTDLFKKIKEDNIVKKHALERPIEAEVSSIKKQIEYAIKNNFKGHLHVCHVSSVESVNLIREYKKKNLGFKLTCGVTSNHVLLSVEKNTTYLNKINPPVRFEKDRVKLFEALVNDKIDIIESDHAPHTLLEKKNNFSGVPSFIGQIILLDVLEKYLDKSMLENLYGKRINNYFNLNHKIDLPNKEQRKVLIEKYRNEYEFDPFKYFRLCYN